MPDINDMTFNEVMPSESKYLAKGDVDEDGVILTIWKFTLDTIKSDDGDKEKLIMWFKESVYKPLVLNSTNKAILEMTYPECKKIGDYAGKQMVVFADPNVSYGGKLTGGLRLKRIPGAPKAVTGHLNALPDDSVPF
jgi:hypothetical protein